MELRLGYKRTEIGPIPDEWSLKALGEISDLEVGLSKPRIIFGHGCLVVTVQDLYKGSTVDTSALKRVVVTEEEIRKYRLFKNDILIGNASVKRDGIGYANRYDGALENVIFAKYAYRARNLRSMSPIFLHHVLRADFCRKWIVAISQTGTLTNLSKQAARSIPIPVPNSWSEQQAIGSALSDVDALIAGLEKLIIKKLDLKQAAMQQLLTGQTRLPGFSAEWELRQLQQLGTFLKGSGVKRDEAMSGELPCVRYGEIYTVHSDVVRTFHSRISPQVAATATPIQKGDLLFAGSGETKAEIGKCVAMSLPMEAYAGGDIVILRLRSGNPSFFGYLLNTPAVVRQKSNLGQGDAVVHISALALSSVEVEVPSIEEQTAIATVLSDMDVAISALKGRLAKTRELKQGMMQELLTGRTRLV